MNYQFSSAIILMYHRIIHTEINPWGICVSPDYFETQIQFLTKNFDVISLDELLENLQLNTIPRNSVCITFDDGYADNFINARPVLEYYKCPATFFIPAAFVNDTSFWWDVLQHIFLQLEKLPSYLHITTNTFHHDFFIKEHQLSTREFELHKKWRWHEVPPTSRCRIFLQVRDMLQPLALQEIEQIIEQLIDWAGCEALLNAVDKPMTGAQLMQLHANNLFTAGLHTHTHACLDQKTKAIQYNEIKTCKDFLLKHYSINANILAYPYGRYNDETIQLADELQLKGCVTTNASSITNTSNIYTLGRLQVCNWNPDALYHQMSALCNNTHATKTQTPA